MEFKGNKGEWSELYTLLKLLADGEIYAADENMDKFEKLVFPILQIFREEKNFKINYLVNGSIKLVEGVTKKTICEINKKKFLDAANIVFNNMKKLSGRSLHVNRFDKKDELLSFLKEARIESIKAKSTDKSDIIIQVHDSFTGGNSTLGFSIKSMLGQKSTLFNAGPGTNFIFDIDGTICSKQHSVSGVTRWHHTVKHVDSKGNIFQNIYRSSHTHQVPRFVFR